MSDVLLESFKLCRKTVMRSLSTSKDQGLFRLFRVQVCFGDDCVYLYQQLWEMLCVSSHRETCQDSEVVHSKNYLEK